MNRAAHPAVRAALPARAVLEDPVFRPDLSFDQRTAQFVALLHRHVDRRARSGDRLLLTVATQCEARALARWLGKRPARRRPWTVALFLSDRWNRAGADEREQQMEELAAAAAELAELAPEAAHRLILGAVTSGLRAEIGGLLGVEIGLAPIPLLAGRSGAEGDALVRRALPPEGVPPRVAVIGGARPEKGSNRLPAIFAACRELGPIELVLHLVNELLPAESFAELLRLGEAPGVRAVHGALDREAYLALFDDADPVLLPYARIPYRQRASGVLIEAAAAGLPVVVPSGTWLAEQVESGDAAGTIYAGDDPASIAAAVRRCSEALPALSRHSAERARSWREHHSVDAVLDWVEAAIAARGPG